MGRTEARFLDPLEELVDRGRCPADDALDAVGPEPGTDPQARVDLIRAFYFAGTEV
jgi:hypothetical protein